MIKQQFSDPWHLEDCAHNKNGTANMESTVILDMGTLAVNRSGFVHLLPVRVFVPLHFTHTNLRTILLLSGHPYYLGKLKDN